MPILDTRHNRIALSDLIISSDMVAKKLKKLKPTKSAGPDGLHPRVLKETADTICYPLRGESPALELEDETCHSNEQEGK